MDNFYLNLIAVKIFTNSEYELFIRAAYKHQQETSSAQKKLTMAVTSSKVAGGEVPDPEDDDDGDPWRALDKAG